MRIAALLIAALVVCVSSADALYTAYRTGTVPVIDAELGDSCWASASVTSRFLSNSTDDAPGEDTRVRLAWDDRCIYIAVEAFEANLAPALNMLHLVPATKSGPDANVFADDCVEIFLDPPGDSYFHFGANSGDGSYDAQATNSAWDSGWLVAAHRGERSYVVEAAIPLEPMGATAEGDWRANFTRHRPAAKEYSTWSGLRGAFHQPEAFGTLRFAEAGPALGPVDIEAGAGEVRLRVTVTAPEGAAPSFRAQATAGTAAAEARTEGPGEKTLILKLPAQAAAKGAYTLAYSLEDGGLPVLASAPIPNRLAAGVVRLNLRGTDSHSDLTVNGKPVDTEAGPVELLLDPGLNLLAIQAGADGENPGVMPSISVEGTALRLRWLTRDEAPAEDWRTALPTQGWGPAAVAPGGLWSKPGAKDCYLVAGIWVGDRGPAFFPKTDTFYMPRGSRQLVRMPVEIAPDLPSEGYRMVLEVPAGLRGIVADALGGAGAPKLERAGGLAIQGREMARYTVSYEHLPGEGMELSMRWGDASGHTLAYQPALTSGGTHDWRHLSVTLTPPPGATSAHPLVIKWQDRGIVGTFWVDNIVLRQEGSGQNLLKMGTFDEPEWGNHWMLVPEGQDGSKCVRIVSTKENADRQQAIWVDKEGVVELEPGAKYVLELDVKCEKLGSPTSGPLVGLLFEADSSQVEGDYPARVYPEFMQGTVVGLPRTARVRVLPALKNARPARARITPCYYSTRFSTPEAAEAFAANCIASGITWTYGTVNNDIAPLLLAEGNRVILSIGWEPWSVLSGTRALIEERPDLAAVDFKGKRIAHTFCPTWVLAEGQPVIDALQKWLLGTVNSQQYAGANWDVEQPVIDPPTFCTCERCLEAFRKFAQIPADVALNADALLSSYPTQWTDFRCAQNAEMAGHIKRILSKADRPVEFSLYSGYQGKRTKEHYGVDWALMAPHLDLAIAGYGGGRTEIRDTMAALGDVPFMGGEMWYLSDRDAVQPTPRMETWRNRILRQYANSGCNGCLIWWLPPMEGGSFYATSEAAQIIAANEDFFLETQRCDEKVQVEGLSAENWFAFEKDGTVLVMLLSFQDKALEASVTLGERKQDLIVEPFGVGLVRFEP